MGFAARMYDGVDEDLSRLNSYAAIDHDAQVVRIQIGIESWRIAKRVDLASFQHRDSEWSSQVFQPLENTCRDRGLISRSYIDLQYMEQ